MDVNTISFKVIEIPSGPCIFCDWINSNKSRAFEGKTHCCALVKDMQGITQSNYQILCGLRVYFDAANINNFRRFIARPLHFGCQVFIRIRRIQFTFKCIVDGPATPIFFWPSWTTLPHKTSLILTPRCPFWPNGIARWHGGCEHGTRSALLPSIVKCLCGLFTLTGGGGLLRSTPDYPISYQYNFVIDKITLIQTGSLEERVSFFRDIMKVGRARERRNYACFPRSWRASFRCRSTELPYHYPLYMTDK